MEHNCIISAYIRTKCLDGPVTKLSWHNHFRKYKPQEQALTCTSGNSRNREFGTAYSGVFWGPGFLNKPDDTKWKIKFVSPIWDIFKMFFSSKFSPFLGEKIVNLIILCCGNTYDCVLVYIVTLISECVDQIQVSISLIITWRCWYIPYDCETKLLFKTSVFVTLL